MHVCLCVCAGVCSYRCMCVGVYSCVCMCVSVCACVGWGQGLSVAGGAIKRYPRGAVCTWFSPLLELSGLSVLYPNFSAGFTRVISGLQNSCWVRLWGEEWTPPALDFLPSMLPHKPLEGAHENLEATPINVLPQGSEGKL